MKDLFDYDYSINQKFYQKNDADPVGQDLTL